MAKLIEKARVEVEVAPAILAKAEAARKAFNK
jgi:hypothetical protein